MSVTVSDEVFTIWDAENAEWVEEPPEFERWWNNIWPTLSTEFQGDPQIEVLAQAAWNAAKTRAGI